MLLEYVVIGAVVVVDGGGGSRTGAGSMIISI